jgi:hypothetical protein
MKTQNNDSVKDQTATCDNNLLVDYHPFDLKPQHRDLGGKIPFVHNKTGFTELYPKAYSYPAKRCENCLFYRVERSTTPVAYYCRIGMFSSYVQATAKRDEDKPTECQVYW